MELNTITEIRTVRDEIRAKIKSADRSAHAESNFGGEQEYNFKGLLGGIAALLTDISSLTKSPNKFVKLSTHGERSVMLQHLNRINTYFDSPANYIPQFEALKVLLRGYGVRNYSERQLVFEEEVSNVLKLKLKLEEEVKSISTLKAQIENEGKEINEKLTSTKKLLQEIDEELDVVYERQEKLSTRSEQLNSKIEEVDEIRSAAGEILDGIKESNSEVKSNEKLIAQFARQVEDRTNQFTKLEQNTDENNKKLEEYELERKKILDESKELIESARQALNYKTAEGISASFQSQYNESNSNWIIGGWITGAVVCLLGTLGLGFLVLSSESTDPLMVIIGRISLLPIPIIGAIFCANQYTKQKNIIEDYAYKMVLSKSIVGFSDQLKANASDNNEEYIHYIKTALEEIHKDPLRSRREKRRREDKNSASLNELVELAERIVSIAKPSE